MLLTGEHVSQGVEPDYREIEPIEQQRLIADMLSRNNELRDSEAPYGLVTLDGYSPYANIARSLERKQFESYFGNTAEIMKDEYAPYESSSLFFLMVDQKNLKPTGVMRIVKPNPNGFKSLNDLVSEKCKTADGIRATELNTEQLFVEMNINPTTTLDVATIAADPEYSESTTGSPIVLATLQRAIYKYSVENGYEDYVAIIDEKPLGQLRKINLPVKLHASIATPFEYLGAKGNTFMHTPVADIKSALDPVVYDYICGDGALYGESDLSFSKQ